MLQIRHLTYNNLKHHNISNTDFVLIPHNNLRLKTREKGNPNLKFYHKTEKKETPVNPFYKDNHT